jgi:hypothetical protein
MCFVVYLLHFPKYKFHSANKSAPCKDKAVSALLDRNCPEFRTIEDGYPMSTSWNQAQALFVKRLALEAVPGHDLARTLLYLNLRMHFPGNIE